MIKPLSIEATVTTVWLDDPAVTPREFSQESFDKLKRDPSCWMSMVDVKEGATPTQFVLGVIPPGDLARIEGECGVGTDKFQRDLLLWKCFLHGLRDILDGPTVTETDAQGRVKNVVPKVKRAGVEYVDPTWLSNIFVRKLRGCAAYIGALIYHWNELGDSDAKN